MYARLSLLVFRINTVNPQPPSDAVRKQTFILEDLFSSVSSQFKKYHPFGNLKLNNLGIFQSLKFRIRMGKILPISLKLNFTRNTLDCCGLMPNLGTLLILHLSYNLPSLAPFSNLFPPNTICRNQRNCVEKTCRNADLLMRKSGVLRQRIGEEGEREGAYAGRIITLAS